MDYDTIHVQYCDGHFEDFEVTRVQLDSCSLRFKDALTNDIKRIDIAECKRILIIYKEEK